MNEARNLLKLYKRDFQLVLDAKNRELDNELYDLLRERSQYYNAIQVENPLAEVSRSSLLKNAHLHAMILCYASYNRDNSLTAKAWYDLLYNDPFFLPNSLIKARDLFVCLTIIYLRKMDIQFQGIIDTLVDIVSPCIPHKDSDYYCSNEFVKKHKDKKYEIKNWLLKPKKIEHWQKRNIKLEDWRLYTMDFCRDTTPFFLEILHLNSDIDLHSIVDIIDGLVKSEDINTEIELDGFDNLNDVISYMHNYIDMHILSKRETYNKITPEQGCTNLEIHVNPEKQKKEIPKKKRGRPSLSFLNEEFISQRNEYAMSVRKVQENLYNSSMKCYKLGDKHVSKDVFFTLLYFLFIEKKKSPLNANISDYVKFIHEALKNGDFVKRENINKLIKKVMILNEPFHLLDENKINNSKMKGISIEEYYSWKESYKEINESMFFL